LTPPLSPPLLAGGHLDSFFPCPRKLVWNHFFFQVPEILDPTFSSLGDIAVPFFFFFPPIDVTACFNLLSMESVYLIFFFHFSPSRGHLFLSFFFILSSFISFFRGDLVFFFFFPGPSRFRLLERLFHTPFPLYQSNIEPPPFPPPPNGGPRFSFPFQSMVPLPPWGFPHPFLFLFFVFFPLPLSFPPRRGRFS